MWIFFILKKVQPPEICSQPKTSDPKTLLQPYFSLILSMKVFVTGSNGFVAGYVIRQLLCQGHQVIASSRSEDLSPFKANPDFKFVQMDLTDSGSVEKAFALYAPDAVVHAAALSKPDDCERNQDAAYALNVGATEGLLLQAEKHQSHFIFFSSDFVFNGETGMYTEEDYPDPLSYYGYTKMKAEEAVTRYPFAWTIVRTVLVYGNTLYGRDSFVTMIAKMLQNKEPYRLVDDQVRTPTYAGDIADAIAAILERKATGIYHICGKDQTTPYKMALDIARFLRIADPTITPVPTAALKELARRPLRSGLSIQKAVRELGYSPHSFEGGLKLSLG